MVCKYIHIQITLYTTYFLTYIEYCICSCFTFLDMLHYVTHWCMRVHYMFLLHNDYINSKILHISEHVGGLWFNSLQPVYYISIKCKLSLWVHSETTSSFLANNANRHQYCKFPGFSLTTQLTMTDLYMSVINCLN